MLDAIKSIMFGAEERDVLYECRRCGASLTDADATCSYCETSDVATFEV